MSEVLTWKPEFSVHIAELDRQHQRLFRIIQELHRSIVAGHGHALIESAIARVVSYTIEHFATEENFMDEHGFPGSAAHRLEHNVLTLEIDKLQKEYEAGNADAAMKLLDFLQRWQVEHILRADMQYGEFGAAQTVE
ncbi:MAG TPA: bacteriohemerythrin [Terriglobales bacterium]|nr:bacteriohemerythrin [Terriglobales bacterium]